MSTEEYPLEIDVQQTQRLLEQAQDFLFVDCREPEENELCRIEGSKLIPMNETPSRIQELSDFQNKRIVVHCHHGVRSMNVVQWLRGNGFPKAQSMAGGIDAWSTEIDAAVKRY